MDRKCNLDEFNARLESKLDRATVNSLLNSRPSRQEIEPVLNSKAEIVEVQQMLQTLELKFEDEFQAIAGHLSRKAAADDLAFYRKETQAKADKDSLDDLRLEIYERLATSANSLNEKDQYLTALADSLEGKLDERICDLRNKMNGRFDEISSNRQKDLVSRIVGLSE